MNYLPVTPRLKQQEKLKMISNRTVIKSNQLVTRVYKLTLRSQKLFSIMIALINSNRAMEFAFWCTQKELAILLNIDKNTNFKTEIVKIIDELENGSLFWIDPNTATHFISSVRFDENGFVYFEFPEVLKFHVGEVQRGVGFTKYKLSNILPLRSEYTIRLYELVKKEQYKHEFIYWLKDLRKMMNIPDDKYLSYKDFKKRIIVDACNELNLKTDINVTFDEIKFPKTKIVSGIRFKIVRNMKDINEFTEKVKTLLVNKDIDRKGIDMLRIPDEHLNSPNFNMIYRNFIKHLDNFIDGYVFENYIKDNGFRMTLNEKGGRDILIQTKLNL